MEITITSGPLGIIAPWFLVEAIKNLKVPAKKCTGRKEGYFVKKTDLVSLLKKEKQEQVADFWQQVPYSKLVFL